MRALLIDGCGQRGSCVTTNLTAFITAFVPAFVPARPCATATPFGAADIATDAASPIRAGHAAAWSASLVDRARNPSLLALITVCLLRGPS